MAASGRFVWTLVKLVAFAVVAVLVTVFVIFTLLDQNTQSTATFHARFVDASGLQGGDTVRVAGVEVGKVSGVSLDGSQAMVTFSVDSTQHLSTTTRAQVHFENLIGQRFLALVPGSTAGGPLRSGATIPTSRTQPALDLTALFNGFQPLFAALNPQQVNQLTGSVIQVFQGQSGTISQLAQTTAALTSHLADRQAVINQVLDNLSGLLNAVGGHDLQLGQLIDQFSSVVGSLASERGVISSTVQGVSQLTSGVSQILANSQPAIDQDLTGLANASNSLAANQHNLDAVLTGFNGFISTLAKVSDSGNYLSVYACNLTLNISGRLNLSLVPGVPAPQAPVNVQLPSGVVGTAAQHTANCS